jgi:hypothetical protein
MVDSLGLCNARQTQQYHWKYPPISKVNKKLTLGSIAAARGRKKVGDSVW